MKQDVLEFIKDPTKALEIINIIQVQTMFNIFRNLAVELMDSKVDLCFPLC